MSRTVNFLRGWRTVTVSGLFPERMLNLCAQQRISFWGLEWIDEGNFRFRVAERWLPRLPLLAERAQCTLERGAGAGLPAFLRRFRRRYAFLTGLLLSAAMVGVLSNFILSVEVTGCETVPQAAVLSELRRLGVYPGAYGPAIDGSAVGQQALVELQELAWMSVNIRGTRAEIIVKEATPPPEVVDEGVCVDIVAATDGVVSQVEVLAGQALCREGDAVLEGEVLIAGLVEALPPQYSQLEPSYFSVHAMGRVWADTRRTLRAAIPLSVQVKRYTGEEETRYSLTLLGHRINFYQNSGIMEGQCDKISKTRVLTLPDGRQFPASLTRTTSRTYQTETAEVDLDAAQTLLEGRLLEELTALVGGEGTIRSYEFRARVEGGLLIVTVEAACREQIGRSVPAAEQGE